MIPLKSGCQTYAWGKPYSSSIIKFFMNTTAILPESSGIALTTGNSDVDTSNLDETSCLAELWMGVHPKNESHVLLTEENICKYNLVDCTKDHNNLYSITLSKFYYFLMRSSPGHLQSFPFLYKILSIEKALSIQSHPDKKLAKLLHKRDPEHYPDDNHKPELVIAISSMIVLCLFKPLDDILSIFIQYSEFKSLFSVPNDLVTVQEILNSLKQIFSSDLGVKDQEQSLIRSLVHYLYYTVTESHNIDMLGKLQVKLISKLAGHNKLSHNELLEIYRKECQSNRGKRELYFLLPELSMQDSVFLHVSTQYPGDKGLWLIYFLNIIKLNRSQSIFLEPNTPHCYIYGEAVEVMSNSDNVIRLGLTQKYKDCETIMDSLNFSPSVSVDVNLRSTKPNFHFKFIDYGWEFERYAPNCELFPEFSVQRVEFDCTSLSAHTAETYPYLCLHFLQCIPQLTNDLAIFIIIDGTAVIYIPKDQLTTTPTNTPVSVACTINFDHCNAYRIQKGDKFIVATPQANVFIQPLTSTFTAFVTTRNY